MQRYYLVHDDDMPPQPGLRGAYHFIELSSHGPAGAAWNLLALSEPHSVAPSAWHALPPLYDAGTTLAVSPVPHKVLADIGLDGSETTVRAVAILSAISPAMSPGL